MSINEDQARSYTGHSITLIKNAVRYKGDRIYLDELPADAKGRPLKSMKAVECGLFCEEPAIEALIGAAL